MQNYTVPIFHLQSSCIFLSRKLGLKADPLAPIVVPPYRAEMFSQQDRFLSAKLQDRKSSGRNTAIHAVPAGLDPLEHFEQGCLARSPLECSSAVPADLDFCVDMLVEYGPRLDQWRESQFKLFSDHLEALAPVSYTHLTLPTKRIV